MKNLFLIILLILCSNNIIGQKTYSVAELYNMCIEFKNYSPRDIESRLNKDDYYATADELFSDANLFEDRLGNSITTMHLGSQNKIFNIIYEIKLLSKSKIDAINNELNNFFYSYSYNDSDGKVVKTYTSDGKCVIDISYDKTKQKYKINIINNIDALFLVHPKRINNSKLEINSFVNTTNIFLKKGEKIKIKASGNINFGTWAGYGGPNGVDGFENYNKIQGFRHGALLATIGNQNAVAVGNEVTITANQNGKLFLYVNDSDPSNNSGSFIVEYSIIK